jgi:NAD(P)H-hydrate epimerase
MDLFTLSRTQAVEYDRAALIEFGLPGLVLMENAGRSVAELMLRLIPHLRQHPVRLVCGKGNNGGDGFVIARHLHNAGVAVRVLLCCAASEITGDAALVYPAVERSGLVVPFAPPAFVAELGRAEGWIVDALFGTGLRGSIRAPLNEIVEALNRAPAQRLAVDIPSGLDCNLGTAFGPTVRANLTCTFVALKLGMVDPNARKYLGQTHIIDIGAPRALTERFRTRTPKDTPND